MLGCTSGSTAPVYKAALRCWTDRHECQRCVFERCASVDVHSLGLESVRPEMLHFRSPARYESRAPARVLGRVLGQGSGRCGKPCLLVSYRPLAAKFNRAGESHTRRALAHRSGTRCVGALLLLPRRASRSRCAASPLSAAVHGRLVTPLHPRDTRRIAQHATTNNGAVHR